MVLSLLSRGRIYRLFHLWNTQGVPIHLQAIFLWASIGFLTRKIRGCQKIERSPPEWHRYAIGGWLPPGDRHETLPSSSESSLPLSKGCKPPGEGQQTLSLPGPKWRCTASKEGRKQNPSVLGRGLLPLLHNSQVPPASGPSACMGKTETPLGPRILHQ